MNPITSRFSANRDNHIVGLDFLERFVFWQDADVATKHQWIADISIVKIDRTVDGRNSHSITVVTDTRYHALHHATWMKHSVGDLIRRSVRICKTKYIRIANRFCTQPRSKCVTNDATNSSIGSTIRLNRGRTVVSFNFEGDIDFIIECDNARVVFENTNAPVVVPELFHQIDRRLKDRFLEHVLKKDRSIFVGVLDSTC